MKWKFPFLTLAAIIHIVYSIINYQTVYRQHGDSWGFGAMGLRIEIFGGILAIVIDLILMRSIRKTKPFIVTEFFLILIGASIFYR